MNRILNKMFKYNLYTYIQITSYNSYNKYLNYFKK